MEDENSAGHRARILSVDDEEAIIDPLSPLEHKIDDMFHSEDLVEFMRSEGLTLPQVRDFLKHNYRPAEHYASLLNESSDVGYPLHQFVSTSVFLNQADDEVTAEWLGLISDLIRAFPQALWLQDDDWDSTPLHLCAASVEGDNGDLCRLLVDFCRAACMLRHGDYDEYLPLQTAIERGNWNVASVLLEETIKCGIDLSQQAHPLIHIAIDCDSRPDYGFLKKLLRKVPGSCRMKNQDGDLPLMYAICSDNRTADPEFLRILIEDNPEALRTPDEEGNLPLHKAPCSLCSTEEGDDYLAAIKLLIDEYPEGLSTRNHKGQLPLHVCVYAATELTDSEEEMEVLRLVSERYPAVHTDVDKDGNSLLHIACDYARPELAVVRFLAAQNEAAVSTANAKGCLPLHLAVETSNNYAIAVANFLVEAFPKGAQMRNSKGNLPLHVALSPRLIPQRRFPFAFDDAAVKFLVEAFPESLQTQNAEGNLPLHVAVSPVPDRILHSADFVKYLLDQYPGAALRANATGSLPLHLACSNKLAPFAYVDLLVKQYPMALSLFDGDGLLPFHRACLRDKDGTLVQKMLQAWFQGRDLPLTENNMNALFFACESNASLDIVKFFAEKSSAIFRTFANNVKVSKK